MSALSGPRGAALDSSTEDSTKGGRPQVSLALKRRQRRQSEPSRPQDPLGREKPTAAESMHDLGHTAYTSADLRCSCCSISI